MKTAISIPDPLFAAAEQLARRIGISRSELFQRAIRSYLKEHKDKGITESLNDVYPSGEPDRGLDSLLELLQGASIAREDW